MGASARAVPTDTRSIKRNASESSEANGILSYIVPTVAEKNGADERKVPVEDKTREIGIQAAPQPKPRGDPASVTYNRAASDPYPTWWTTEQLRPETPQPACDAGKGTAPSALCGSIALSDESDPAAPSPRRRGKNWVTKHISRRQELRTRKTLLLQQLMDLEAQKARRKEMIANLDPGFIECVRSSFQVFDFDGSGTLKQNELTNLIRAMGLSVDQESLDAFMAENDLDGDGEIDEEEFVFFMAKTHQPEKLQNLAASYSADTFHSRSSSEHSPRVTSRTAPSSPVNKDVIDPRDEMRANASQLSVSRVSRVSRSSRVSRMVARKSQR